MLFYLSELCNEKILNELKKLIIHSVQNLPLYIREK